MSAKLNARLNCSKEMQDLRWSNSPCFLDVIKDAGLSKISEVGQGS